MAKVSLDGHDITTLVLTPASGAAVTKSLVATNTYAAGDEGKVVKNGALVAQSARSSSITVNGTYDTTENNSVTVSVSGGSATLGTKTITANGTYNASSDSLDGYSSVTVNVSGGSSARTGTITPTENTDTYTISALAGMTENHFLLKPSGSMENGILSNARSFTCLFIDFSAQCFFDLTSNATGQSWRNYGATEESTAFDAQTGDLDNTVVSFIRSTGVFTCKNPTANGGGYLLANVEYTWYAW